MVEDTEKSDNKKWESTTTCGSSQNESNNKNPERIRWENIMIHASISAMNSLLACACNNRTLKSTGDIAKDAVRMGKALTDELRRELSSVRGDNEKEI